MKIATYHDGSRDGQLVVVSRDLASAHYATGIATRLQQVLDDWNFLAPQLEDLSAQLNGGRGRHAFAFDPARCMAPLPRAFQRARAIAYPQHIALARQALGGPAGEGDAPPQPLRLQAGGGDDFRGPCDDVSLPADAVGADFCAELLAITGDVAAGVSEAQAQDGIRLLAIAGDLVLRGGGPDAAAPCDGFARHPATVFGPVAITPDEFGDAWDGGRIRLVLQAACNGRRLGLCDAGIGMRFSFGALVAAMARLRRVPAGSVVGTGPVSNAGTPGADGAIAWPRGASCIAEKRWIETLQDGAPQTAFLAPGDTVRIEMKGHDGRSVFGAVEHRVVAA